MSNVVDLRNICQPKRVVGGKRNVSWEIWYDREAHGWHYAVTVRMAPLTLESNEPMSEGEARRIVDRLVKETVR